MGKTARTRKDPGRLAADQNASAGRSESNDALPRHLSLGNIGTARPAWLWGNSRVLTVTRLLCYGSRLSSPLLTTARTSTAIAPGRTKVLSDQPIGTIFGGFCHALYCVRFVLYL